MLSFDTLTIKRNHVTLHKQMFIAKKPIFTVFSFLIIISITYATALVFFQKQNTDTMIPKLSQSAQVLGSNKTNEPVKQTVSPPLTTLTPAIRASNTTIKRTVYLGMWTQGFWNDSTKVLSPQTLETVQQKLGKNVAIAHYYRGWQFLDSPEFLSELETINRHGWRPMVSANPYYFDKCMVEGKKLYRMIADGHCDAFLHSVGKNLKAYNKPVFLRFAWEMNIDSIEWGIQKTGDTPQDYINAWQRFHTIVRQENASNVIWVFSPNTETPTSIPYQQLYPGDAYVDWLALDGYNWGTTQPWSSWLGFSQVFSQSYNHIATLSPNKPIMLGEVNTTDRGGDKAEWYTNMLTKEIPYNYPRLQAVIFYNEDRTATEKVNWLIDVTPQTLKAFRNGINSSTYLSSF